LILRKNSWKIIVPVISIIIIASLIFGIQNIELDSQANYPEIIEFSTEEIETNLHLLVKVSEEIPDKDDLEKRTFPTLAFGYIWVQEQINSNQFSGIFTNHHLTDEGSNQGWHTEIVKASLSSNKDIDFCLELDEFFSETIISRDTILTITSFQKDNLKNIKQPEIYSVETSFTSSCPSNIGAKTIQHLYG